MKNILFALMAFLFLQSCSDDDVVCEDLALLEFNDEINPSFLVTLDPTIDWEIPVTQKSRDIFSAISNSTNPLEIKFEVINAQNFDLEHIKIGSLDTTGGTPVLTDEVELTENSFSTIESLSDTFLFNYGGKVVERACDFVLQLKYTFKVDNENEIRYVNIVMEQ